MPSNDMSVWNPACTAKSNSGWKSLQRQRPSGTWWLLQTVVGKNGTPLDYRVAVSRLAHHTVGGVIGFDVDHDIASGGVVKFNGTGHAQRRADER